jgi:hypothetical protein
MNCFSDAIYPTRPYIGGTLVHTFTYLVLAFSTVYCITIPVMVVNASEKHHGIKILISLLKLSAAYPCVGRQANRT